MNGLLLLDGTTAEVLLALGIFFCVAAIVLFALSARACNSRDLTWKQREILRLFSRGRFQRRWYFNTGSPDGCHHCRNKLTV